MLIPYILLETTTLLEVFSLYLPVVLLPRERVVLQEFAVLESPRQVQLRFHHK